LMTSSPRKRFGLSENLNDFTVYDLNARYNINPDEFLSMGKSTPFAGWRVYGKCMATFLDGKPVWLAPEAREILKDRI
ncbi:MAG: hypothetical protein PHW77_08435, partial [Eubacteriales bacterium]|nr:hypothetical protein [Eubacteriales bacterium]